MYLWINNVPKALRRGKEKGCAVLLAYVPQVCGTICSKLLIVTYIHDIFH